MWDVKLWAAKKEPLELKRVVLFHVHNRDLDVRLWFGLLNELADDIIVVTFLIDCFVRDILTIVNIITLKMLIPVYCSAIGWNSKIATSSVVANDIQTVTESPNQDKTRTSGQTLISPSS